MFNKKKLIIGAIIIAVLLISGMIYSLSTYEFDASVANSGDQDSVAAQAENQDTDSQDEVSDGQDEATDSQETSAAQ